MPKKIIDGPDYVGVDRRQDADVILVSQKSFSWILMVVSLVGILVAWGVSWGTAKIQISGKVDRIEQVQVDARQDAERLLIKNQIIEIGPKLDAIQQRLTEFVCEGKPRSCR